VIHGEKRCLMALAGLGALGSAGLVLSLVDDERRGALWHEVQSLAPWQAHMRPEQGAEICVQITALAGAVEPLLNRARFDARVVAVAVDGAGVTVRNPPVELELELENATRDGLRIRLGESSLRLPPKRFALLSLLAAAHPAGMTREELCANPALLSGWNWGRDHVAKLVHDTNAQVRKTPGLQHLRLIRFDHKTARYVLTVPPLSSSGGTSKY
jgi:hypothetical protein